MPDRHRLSAADHRPRRGQGPGFGFGGSLLALFLRVGGGITFGVFEHIGLYLSAGYGYAPVLKNRFGGALSVRLTTSGPELSAM